MASWTAMLMDPAILFFERRSGSWGLPFPDAAALQSAPSLLTITNYLRNRLLPLLLGAPLVSFRCASVTHFPQNPSVPDEVSRPMISGSGRIECSRIERLRRSDKRRNGTPREGDAMLEVGARGRQIGGSNSLTKFPISARKHWGNPRRQRLVQAALGPQGGCPGFNILGLHPGFSAAS